MILLFKKPLIIQQINWIIISIITLLTPILAVAHESLMETYNQASNYGRYDKYLELDPSLPYDGDLVIPSGQNVYIDGRGALIFGGESDISVWVSDGSNLDIQQCIFVGGQIAILFDSLVSGTINNNTIVGTSDAAIRAQLGFDNAETYIWSNIIVDCLFGIYCIDSIPAYVAFNDIYGIDSLRYALYCPG